MKVEIGAQVQFENLRSYEIDRISQTTKAFQVIQVGDEYLQSPTS